MEFHHTTTTAPKYCSSYSHLVLWSLCTIYVVDVVVGSLFTDHPFLMPHPTEIILMCGAIGVILQSAFRMLMDDDESRHLEHAVVLDDVGE